MLFFAVVGACFAALLAVALRMLTDSIYRDALRTNILVKLYMLDVDIGHLISFNEELAHKLANEPAEIIPIVRSLSSQIPIMEYH